jgi:hypothetical protein
MLAIVLTKVKTMMVILSLSQLGVMRLSSPQMEEMQHDDDDD